MIPVRPGFCMDPEHTTALVSSHVTPIPFAFTLVETFVSGQICQVAATRTERRLFAQVDFRREMRPIAFVDPGAFLVTYLVKLPQEDQIARVQRVEAANMGQQSSSSASSRSASGR
jgi:hypothetical protein